ncbi:MAG: hypothetical protein ACM3NQ_10485 [Bacteroidales bacterium]
MRKHVELVGVLYFVWGAIGLLLGVAFLALAFGTAAIDVPSEEAGSLAVGVIVGMFGVLAGLCLIWGCVHLWDAVAIRRHRHSGRAVAMVLAVLNLFLLPFGTALGVYALWVLTQEQARPLFDASR